MKTVKLVSRRSDSLTFSHFLPTSFTLLLQDFSCAIVSSSFCRYTTFAARMTAGSWYMSYMYAYISTATSFIRLFVFCSFHLVTQMNCIKVNFHASFLLHSFIMDFQRYFATFSDDFFFVCLFNFFEISRHSQPNERKYLKDEKFSRFVS